MARQVDRPKWTTLTQDTSAALRSLVRSLCAQRAALPADAPPRTPLAAPSPFAAEHRGGDAAGADRKVGEDAQHVGEDAQDAADLPQERKGGPEP